MATYALLTSTRIKAATAARKDVWLSDSTGLRGAGRLLLRITRGGTRRFYYRGLVNGKRQTVPLGPYSYVSKAGYLTLEQARQRARALSSTALVESSVTSTAGPVAGIQGAPPEENSQINHVPVNAQKISVLELCTLYVHQLALRKQPSAVDTGNVVKNHIAPSPIASIDARSLTSGQVTQLLRGMLNAGIRRTTNKVRSILHAAYELGKGGETDANVSQALADLRLTFNPIAGVRALTALSKPRERALSRSEFKFFWLHLIAEPPLSMEAHAVRLTILLGGQRCRPLVRVLTANVDRDARVVSLHDSKGKGRQLNPRLHRVPYVTRGEKEILWLLDHSRTVKSPYLLARASSPEPIRTDAVSKLVRQICRTMLDKGEAVGQFQYGDIRKTIESTLAELDVPPHVRAHLQSHDLSGIQTKHYDFHDYLKQMRAALRVLEKLLDDFEAGDSGSETPKE